MSVCIKNVIIFFFLKAFQMMQDHFSAPDSVSHYEKITTFTLISCHGGNGLPVKQPFTLFLEFCDVTSYKN